MKQKTIFIAEAGVNHNGQINLAKKVIDKAKFAGADYIKFQAFQTKDISTNFTRLTPYQKKNAIKSKNQRELLKKLELTQEQLIYLKKYSERKKIKFLLSFFDENSLKFVEKLNLDFYKIPSPELTNLLLINKIKKKKKILLSCGLAKFNEIKKVLNILKLKKFKKKDLILMHCNSAYPTPVEDINLKKIEYLREKFNLQVGFSDHSIGDLAVICAKMLGVNIIEKHFTLNKKLKGPDHKTSMEPNEFKNMITKVKIVNKMLGRKNVFVTNSEKINLKFIKKYLVAKENIIKGEKFTLKNITAKRAEEGIPSFNYKKVINKKSKFNFKIDEKIKL